MASISTVSHASRRLESVSPYMERLVCVLGPQLCSAALETDYEGLRRLVDRMEEDQLVQLHRTGGTFSTNRSKHRVVVGSRIVEYLMETHGMSEADSIQIGRRLVDANLLLEFEHQKGFQTSHDRKYQFYHECTDVASQKELFQRLRPQLIAEQYARCQIAVWQALQRRRGISSEYLSEKAERWHPPLPLPPLPPSTTTVFDSGGGEGKIRRASTKPEDDTVSQSPHPSEASSISGMPTAAPLLLLGQYHLLDTLAVVHEQKLHLFVWDERLLSPSEEASTISSETLHRRGSGGLRSLSPEPRPCGQYSLAGSSFSVQKIKIQRQEKHTPATVSAAESALSPSPSSVSSHPSSTTGSPPIAPASTPLPSETLASRKSSRGDTQGRFLHEPILTSSSPFSTTHVDGPSYLWTLEQLRQRFLQTQTFHPTVTAATTSSRTTATNASHRPPAEVGSQDSGLCGFSGSQGMRPDFVSSASSEGGGPPVTGLVVTESDQVWYEIVVALPGHARTGSGSSGRLFTGDGGGLSSGASSTNSTLSSASSTSGGSVGGSGGGGGGGGGGGSRVGGSGLAGQLPPASRRLVLQLLVPGEAERDAWIARLVYGGSRLRQRFRRIRSNSLQTPKPETLTLTEVVQTPQLLAVFQEYCDSQLCGENVSFLSSVEAYIRARKEDRPLFAIRIYRHFIRQDGTETVNIATRVFEQIQRAIPSSIRDICNTHSWQELRRRISPNGTAEAEAPEERTAQHTCCCCQHRRHVPHREGSRHLHPESSPRSRSSSSSARPSPQFHTAELISESPTAGNLQQPAPLGLTRQHRFGSSPTSMSRRTRAQLPRMPSATVRPRGLPRHQLQTSHSNPGSPFRSMDEGLAAIRRQFGRPRHRPHIRSTSASGQEAEASLGIVGGSFDPNNPPQDDDEGMEGGDPTHPAHLNRQQRNHLLDEFVAAASRDAYTPGPSSSAAATGASSAALGGSHSFSQSSSVQCSGSSSPIPEETGSERSQNPSPEPDPGPGSLILRPGVAFADSPFLHSVDPGTGSGGGGGSGKSRSGSGSPLLLPPSPGSGAAMEEGDEPEAAETEAHGGDEDGQSNDSRKHRGLSAERDVSGCCCGNSVEGSQERSGDPHQLQQDLRDIVGIPPDWDPPVDLFAQAAAQVYTLLAQDVWPRFRHSLDFQIMLQDCLDRELGLHPTFKPRRLSFVAVPHVEDDSELHALAVAVSRSGLLEDERLSGKMGSGRTLNKVVSGGILLDWMLEKGYATTRPEAISLGQRLCSAMYLRHVDDAYEFEDGRFYYVMHEEELLRRFQERSLSSSSSTESTVSPPSAVPSPKSGSTTLELMSSRPGGSEAEAPSSPLSGVKASAVHAWLEDCCSCLADPYSLRTSLVTVTAEKSPDGRSCCCPHSPTAQASDSDPTTGSGAESTAAEDASSALVLSRAVSTPAGAHSSGDGRRGPRMISSSQSHYRTLHHTTATTNRGQFPNQTPPNHAALHPPPPPLLALPASTFQQRRPVVHQALLQNSRTIFSGYLLLKGVRYNRFFVQLRQSGAAATPTASSVLTAAPVGTPGSEPSSSAEHPPLMGAISSSNSRSSGTGVRSPKERESLRNNSLLVFYRTEYSTHLPLLTVSLSNAELYSTRPPLWEAQDPGDSRHQGGIVGSSSGGPGMRIPRSTSTSHGSLQSGRQSVSSSSIQSQSPFLEAEDSRAWGSSGSPTATTTLNNTLTPRDWSGTRGFEAAMGVGARRATKFIPAGGGSSSGVLGSGGSWMSSGAVGASPGSLPSPAAIPARGGTVGVSTPSSSRLQTASPLDSTTSSGSARRFTFHRRELSGKSGGGERIPPSSAATSYPPVSTRPPRPVRTPRTPTAIAAPVRPPRTGQFRRRHLSLTDAETELQLKQQSSPSSSSAVSPDPDEPRSQDGSRPSQEAQRTPVKPRKMSTPDRLPGDRSPSVLSRSATCNDGLLSASFHSGAPETAEATSAGVPLAVFASPVSSPQLFPSARGSRDPVQSESSPKSRDGLPSIPSSLALSAVEGSEDDPEASSAARMVGITTEDGEAASGEALPLLRTSSSGHPDTEIPTQITPIRSPGQAAIKSAFTSSLKQTPHPEVHPWGLSDLPETPREAAGDTSDPPLDGLDAVLKGRNHHQQQQQQQEGRPRSKVSSASSNSSTKRRAASFSVKSLRPRPANRSPFQPSGLVSRRRSLQAGASPRAAEDVQTVTGEPAEDGELHGGVGRLTRAPTLLQRYRRRSSIRLSQARRESISSVPPALQFGLLSPPSEYGTLEDQQSTAGLSRSPSLSPQQRHRGRFHHHGGVRRATLGSGELDTRQQRSPAIPASGGAAEADPPHIHPTPHPLLLQLHSPQQQHGKFMPTPRRGRHKRRASDADAYLRQRRFRQSPTQQQDSGSPLAGAAELLEPHHYHQHQQQYSEGMGGSPGAGFRGHSRRNSRGGFDPLVTQSGHFQSVQERRSSSASSIHRSRHIEFGDDGTPGGSGVIQVMMTSGTPGHRRRHSLGAHVRRSSWGSPLTLGGPNSPGDPLIAMRHRNSRMLGRLYSLPESPATSGDGNDAAHDGDGDMDGDRTTDTTVSIATQTEVTDPLSTQPQQGHHSRTASRVSRTSQTSVRTLEEDHASQASEAASEIARAVRDHEEELEMRRRRERRAQSAGPEAAPRRTRKAALTTEKQSAGVEGAPVAVPVSPRLDSGKEIGKSPSQDFILRGSGETKETTDSRDILSPIPQLPTRHSRQGSRNLLGNVKGGKDESSSCSSAKKPLRTALEQPRRSDESHHHSSGVVSFGPQHWSQGDIVMPGAAPGMAQDPWEETVYLCLDTPERTMTFRFDALEHYDAWERVLLQRAGLSISPTPTNPDPGAAPEEGFWPPPGLKLSSHALKGLQSNVEALAKLRQSAMKRSVRDSSYLLQILSEGVYILDSLCPLPVTVVSTGAASAPLTSPLASTAPHSNSASFPGGSAGSPLSGGSAASVEGLPAGLTGPGSTSHRHGPSSLNSSPGPSDSSGLFSGSFATSQAAWHLASTVSAGSSPTSPSSSSSAASKVFPRPLLETTPSVVVQDLGLSRFGPSTAPSSLGPRSSEQQSFPPGRSVVRGSPASGSPGAPGTIGVAVGGGGGGGGRHQRQRSRSISNAGPSGEGASAVEQQSDPLLLNRAGTVSAPRLTSSTPAAGGRPPLSDGLDPSFPTAGGAVVRNPPPLPVSTHGGSSPPPLPQTPAPGAGAGGVGGRPGLPHSQSGLSLALAAGAAERGGSGGRGSQEGHPHKQPPPGGDQGVAGVLRSPHTRGRGLGHRRSPSLYTTSAELYSLRSPRVQQQQLQQLQFRALRTSPGLTGGGVRQPQYSPPSPSSGPGLVGSAPSSTGSLPSATEPQFSSGPPPLPGMQRSPPPLPLTPRRSPPPLLPSPSVGASLGGGDGPVGRTRGSSVAAYMDSTYLSNSGGGAPLAVTPNSAQDRKSPPPLPPQQQ